MDNISIRVSRIKNFFKKKGLSLILKHGLRGGQSRAVIGNTQSNIVAKCFFLEIINYLFTFTLSKYHRYQMKSQPFIKIFTC